MPTGAAPRVLGAAPFCSRLMSRICLKVRSFSQASALIAGKEKTVRYIKVVTLATVATAIVLLGATSAGAETTQLCKKPAPEACEAITEAHFLSVNLPPGDVTKDGKVVLLNETATVECEVLIKATNPTGTNPVVFNTVSLVYTNCNNGCKVTVIAVGTISFLKLGTELGDVTWNGFVINKNCLFGALNCDYDSNNLVGHFLGASTFGATTNGKGHITYTKALVNPKEKLGGISSCPKTELDALLQSLTPLYIR